MLATDEDAVICDFAETYHVLDIGALDLKLAATLAAGLAPHSRIMRKLAGTKADDPLLLAALAVDELAMIRWLQTTDGTEGKNRPKSVLALLTEPAHAPEPGGITFASPSEFEAYRAQLIGENHVD